MKKTLIMLSMVLSVVCLARGDTFQYGYNFYLGTNVNQIANDTSDAYGVRFTAGQNLTVDQLYIHLTAFTGTPNLVATLYADNGSGGRGSVLATATTTVSATGAQVQTLSSAVSLAEGSVYHLIYSSTNANASNTWTMSAQNSSVCSVQSNNGAYDANYAFEYGTGTYLATRSIAYGLINSSGSTAIGQPYSLTAQSAYAPGSWKGEQFVYNETTARVESVSMSINNSESSTAAVTIRLVDIAAGTELFSGTLAESPTTGVAYYTLNIAEGDMPVLQNGKTYAWMLSSDQAYRIGCFYGQATVPQSVFDYNFQGDEGKVIYGISAGGAVPTTWYDVTQSGRTQDTYFNMTLSAVPEPATLSLLSVFGIAMLRRRSR